MYDDEGPDLEENYHEWLEENCKCNVEEDGCSCTPFDKWVANYYAYIGDSLYEDYRDSLERECV
jgi:hypothetical protein